jgi:hypothetical protein
MINLFVNFFYGGIPTYIGFNKVLLFQNPLSCYARLEEFYTTSFLSRGVYGEKCKNDEHFCHDIIGFLREKYIC